MRLAVYACLGLLLTTTSAIGGSKPLYRPAPAWVLPAPMPDPAKADTGPLVIFDQQQRLANGQVWAYVDGATRITSEQALTQNGTVSVQWQPDEGDLIVHRIAIQRGQQQIDLLADPEPLTVLRRERGLEALAIDGVLTATMPVKGLQIGDILRVSYSVTRADPALKGNMQSLAALIPDQTQVGFARARILWPVGQDVRWKLLAKANATSLTTIGGDRQLTVALPLPKPPELPADAPARFQPVPVLELSTFRDWTDVSRTMAPLFRPVPPAAGSPLATEIARLKAAAPDQRTRAALALQSVQGNVRYLFNGLDHGNYVPQPPETTWAVRYGDCKAKTVLLLTMLDALGVPAEPVLANLQAGDLIPSRLPSASAFNHILVRATIDGQVYWMDGTGGGARLADLADTPNLRHVLPLRAGGAGLMPVATHPNARPNVSIAIDIDQTAGIGLPAPVTLDVTLRGPLVEALKTANAQLTGDKRKEVIDKFVGGLGLRVLATRRDVTFDAADGSARIRVVGLTELGWQREDQRYTTSLDGLTQAIRFDGDRGRPEWRAIPVATPGVESRLARRALRLPQGVGDFTLEGDRTLPSHLAGYTVHRTAELAHNVVTVEDRIDATAAEVAPADIPDVRAKLALARSRTLKVTAPRDYPARWRMIEAADRAGKLKPIEAAFTAAIADAPEKPPAYLNRALFRRGVYDRKGALADLDIVVAQRPTVPALLLRAQILWSLRQEAKALADAKAARQLDPGSDEALAGVAEMLYESGQQSSAIAMLDDAIATGGERKSDLLATKADILSRGRQTAPALAAIDAAIATKPGSAKLLNNRCWIKATLGVQLETALKDCTKSIELGDDSAAPLDSRALVYFKLGRLDDALADLNAALDQRPDQAGSLFLRGVVERKTARTQSDDDLRGARIESPRIDEDYARYGVRPT